MNTKKDAGIDRRKVMKRGVGTLIAAPMLSPIRGRTAGNDVDVIVIGAGIAGLAAAQELTSMGYETVVLEAASRFGGRINTDRGLNAPFELGAAWIHGPEGNPITGLARAIKAKTKMTNDDSIQVFAHDGTRQSDAAIESADARLERLYQEIDDEIDVDLSLEKAIGRVSRKDASDPILRWMRSAYTEFDTGGPSNDLSAKQFDEDQAFGGKDVILTEGYDQIVNSLAKGLDIRLDTRATAVAYAEGEGATVKTSRGTFESYFVVCTVPLGVLKRDAITFHPPLPEAHRNSLTKLGMGSVTKLALRFAKPFWPVDVQYFGLMTETLGRWNYFMNYRYDNISAENILLGFSVGAYARIADAMRDDEMVRDGMNAVRTMFGDTVPEPVDYRTTHWSQDPNTLGAYSYPTVGCRPGDFDGLAKPVARTILLAGEHTTSRYRGTVHGAYISGLDAAKAVDDLSPD